MKKTTLLKILPGAAALLLWLPLSPVHATTRTMTVTVMALGESNVIRKDITRTTFGAGIAHDNPQFRTVMQSPTAAQTAIRNLDLGTLRFSSGTPALRYFWDTPTRSHMDGGVDPALALKVSEMYTFTNSLNMERLFQVNTYQYWLGGNTWVDIFKPEVYPDTINPDVQHVLSDRAAAWVANNKSQIAANQVTYWEVGNEDWAYWNADEYAQIFNEFAAKMKAANSNIRLLAQSFTGNRPLDGKDANTDAWFTEMISAGINTGAVYALSEHEYIRGGVYPADSQGAGSPNDWRIWQTEDMFAQIQSSARLAELMRKVKLYQPGWKVWMTEFNVFQPNPDVADHPPIDYQDVGHALVIADWTGKMLSMNVERLFMHTLDHHPAFNLVQYANYGANENSPRVSAPGYVFGKYAHEFGPKMVLNEITGNQTWGSHKNGNYDALAVYSSVRESDSVYGGYPSLRIMAINRHWGDPINLTIKTKDRPIAGSTKSFYVETLGIPAGGTFMSSNKLAANVVKWSNRVGQPSNTGGVTYTLPPSSVTFFIVPLQ